MAIKALKYILSRTSNDLFFIFKSPTYEIHLKVIKVTFYSAQYHDMVSLWTQGLPLGVGSASGRWVRAVPSSSGTVPPQASSPAGLRSLPRLRCPTTGTRQHSVLSGPAHGHHVVALTSGSGSCLCPLHVTTGTRSGNKQSRL
ncbi:hypothetical protein PoB_006770500 [Plakobranchus ocellatus]|uniref:Uncharacterized protein n=1 Tax=Plakobranchus ocellatus TaxID=259542 RepID=A0AAV4DAS3_9GAST|nr:hypothetical protein PoB_006770500 [Plakobranchus ocellatus]